MIFFNYLEEKIIFIIFQITFIFLNFLFSLLLGEKLLICCFISITLILATIIYISVDFYFKRKKYLNLISLIDNTTEKYLLNEIIKKPNNLENKAYYYALASSCKAMNDKIANLEQEQNDFQEYVEMFAHEIKNPIASLSLMFENTEEKNQKEELQAIENKVEQMLFYARADSLEKDYFISKNYLSNLIHPVIMNYKNLLLRKRIKLDIHDLDTNVYTDEKWIHFIFSQILQNSIKYLNKENKIIEIWSESKDNNIKLYIKDNGCGISCSDLFRVFDKGFTGTNRNKSNSTGMGLYLCKKMCNKLGLNIEIESEFSQFTLVTIIFSNTNFYKITE